MAVIAVGIRWVCRGCCRKCCCCCCKLLWSILRCAFISALDVVWALDGILRTFLIDPIFVAPLTGFLERRREKYNLTAEDTALIDQYFVTHAVGDHVTIRQYCCIFVPSSFCPCCFFQRVYVPHSVLLSSWLTEGTVENRTLKNVLCLIFCVSLAVGLRQWFSWSASALFALFLSGILIAWPTLRLTVMLFMVTLFHQDGRKVLMGLLYFYLLTVPSANIVHNSNSILYSVVCTIVQALRYLADELKKGLRPFIDYLQGFNRKLQREVRAAIKFAQISSLINAFVENSTKIIMPFNTGGIDNAYIRFVEEFDASCKIHWKVDSLKPRLAVQKAFRQGKEAILRRLTFLVRAFRFCSKIHVTVTVWLMYKVTLYVYRYSRDMAFDNHYITAETEFRDMERRRQELQTVLPLEAEELMKFVDFKSLNPIWDEINAMAGNLVSVGFAVLNFIIVHLLNLTISSAATALWTLVKYDSSPPTSPWGTFVQVLHRGRFDGPSQYGSCLIEPREVDWNHFNRSVALISLATFLAVISPYIIRLRPLIANLYLPQAASRRSEWLYRLLLRRRELGPFLAELADSAKRTIWTMPILWELTETFECVRCLSVESDYVLLFRCYRCERRNCNYCIYLTRECGCCGAVMPYSPLGLEQDLIDMKLPWELRAQRALV